jgi:hypothetical protein
MGELTSHLNATREHLEPLVSDTSQIASSVSELEQTAERSS